MPYSSKSLGLQIFDELRSLKTKRNNNNNNNNNNNTQLVTRHKSIMK